MGEDGGGGVVIWTKVAHTLWLDDVAWENSPWLHSRLSFEFHSANEILNFFFIKLSPFSCKLFFIALMWVNVRKTQLFSSSIFTATRFHEKNFRNISKASTRHDPRQEVFGNTLNSSGGSDWKWKTSAESRKEEDREERESAREALSGSTGCCVLCV